MESESAIFAVCIPFAVSRFGFAGPLTTRLIACSDHVLKGASEIGRIQGETDDGHIESRSGSTNGMMLVVGEKQNKVGL